MAEGRLWSSPSPQIRQRYKWSDWQRTRLNAGRRPLKGKENLNPHRRRVKSGTFTMEPHKAIKRQQAAVTDSWMWSPAPGQGACPCPKAAEGEPRTKVTSEAV